MHTWGELVPKLRKRFCAPEAHVILNSHLQNAHPLLVCLLRGALNALTWTPHGIAVGLLGVEDLRGSEAGGTGVSFLYWLFF